MLYLILLMLIITTMITAIMSIPLCIKLNFKMISKKFRIWMWHNIK